MALDLRLSQKMDLQLRLAPQIIQSIEILQLPTVDLQELVKSELDTNEFLEIRSDEDDTAVVTTAPEKKASDQEEGVARELERLEQNGHFDDDEIPRFKSALNYEASDRKLEAMNNTADQRSDQNALSSVLRRKKLPAPAAQPRARKCSPP